ncbi:two component transcriptional regulator, LuxR family [Maricaulis maris MCS10]|uniref:Two component transcriptional regulator, LuxR family n=1 Tax=Maricaulis maris (strain MCS10) TaxID=394221 RepID=Q0AL13_MARMM|nr:response regulator transcription factor [Maricaulis maris]ABI67030.1 two component transcriptional regulator, LuxR family [Maricaulis maris MCS10]
MKILIADDHDLVLDAVRALLENDIPDAEVELVRSGNEVERSLSDGNRYDLVLLDLRMPGIAGVQDVRDLMKRHADQPVAILSGMASPMEVQMLLENGARGFIPKTMPADGLVAAVRLILAGQVFSPIHHTTDPENEPASLTPREREVLFCLQRGEANKEIARSLEIQETTVKLHLRSLSLKLDARNRTEVVVKAIQAGFLA